MNKTKINLKELLKGYYYINSDITEEHFPIPDVIETDNWKLVTIEKTMTADEVLEKIKADGLRPANLYELAIWKQNNEKTMKRFSWTVALGQMWKDADGNHRVPYVYCYSGGGFEFSLGGFGIVWSGDGAFLCFCDKQTLEPKTLSQSSDTLTLETAIKIVKDAGYVIYKQI